MSTDQQEPTKRSAERVSVVVTTYVRKSLADGGTSLMQFVSGDLSEGGIFILTDDLSLFELDEVLGIIVERGERRYFEGQAKVVRSARVFDSEGDLTESGFGLMFLEVGEQFRTAIAEEIASVK